MNSSWYPASAASAFRCVLALGFAAVLFGCNRDKITEYWIPKETIGRTTASTLEPAAQPQIQGKIPAGWQQQQPGTMSMLSFAIPGSGGRNAEISVMSFPGTGANDLMLINIVRENAHLPPLTEAELSKLVEPVEVAGGKGSLIDFTAATDLGAAPAATRVMLTVLARDGMTWFFKLAGDSSLVSEQKPALLEFLKSVTFTTGETAPRQGEFATTNPKQTAPPAMVAGPITGAGSKPTWEIPPGWKEVAPSQMLLAKFAVGGQDGSADVTVSSLAAGGGGVLANVNRWRNQLGLGPIGQEELDKSLVSLDVLGGKAMLVDVNGKIAETGKDSRIVAAIWPRGGETWFFKMMGDPAVAGREKDAFVRFVQSVRFPNVPNG